MNVDRGALLTCPRSPAGEGDVTLHPSLCLSHHHHDRLRAQRRRWRQRIGLVALGGIHERQSGCFFLVAALPDVFGEDQLDKGHPNFNILPLPPDNGASELGRVGVPREGDALCSSLCKILVGCCDLTFTGMQDKLKRECKSKEERLVMWKQINSLALLEIRCVARQCRTLRIQKD